MLPLSRRLIVTKFFTCLILLCNPLQLIFLLMWDSNLCFRAIRYSQLMIISPDVDPINVDSKQKGIFYSVYCSYFMIIIM